MKGTKKLKAKLNTAKKIARKAINRIVSYARKFRVKLYSIMRLSAPSQPQVNEAVATKSDNIKETIENDVVESIINKLDCLVLELADKCAKKKLEGKKHTKFDGFRYYHSKIEDIAWAGTAEQFVISFENNRHIFLHSWVSESHKIFYSEVERLNIDYEKKIPRGYANTFSCIVTQVWYYQGIIDHPMATDAIKKETQKKLELFLSQDQYIVDFSD